VAAWQAFEQAEPEFAQRVRKLFAHLLKTIRTGLRKIRYQPGLVSGCLAETGLSLGKDEVKCPTNLGQGNYG